MDSSSPDAIAPESDAEPGVPCPCAYADECACLSSSGQAYPLEVTRSSAKRPEPSGPVSDAPARGARSGSPASNPYKTRPFRVTPAFFLTMAVRACTLTAMLTTTTADGLTTGGHRCMRAAAATGTAAQRSQSGESGRVGSPDAGEVDGLGRSAPTGPRKGPLSTPLRSHMRALALYRGMYRDHGWACVGLEALLRTATVTIRSARTCRVCRGTGIACGWPPCACGVCSGLGIEIKGG